VVHLKPRTLAALTRQGEVAAQVTLIVSNISIFFNHSRLRTRAHFQLAALATNAPVTVGVSAM
jgi:hypothetical protein